MSQRQAITDHLAAALRAALPDVTLGINKVDSFGEDELPAVNLTRQSENRERNGAGRRCELQLQLRLYTSGRDRVAKAEAIEEAAIEALEALTPKAIGADRIDVGDVDFDEAIASAPHESTRIGITVWYSRPARKL